MRDRPPSWTALIVDDHAGFRAAARALLETAGFRVLGEASSGEAALEGVRRLAPQLVLLDIVLPGLDGFAVCAELSARDDPPIVVLTSSRPVTAYRRRLATSSARGFIAKDELSAEAISALLS